MAEYTQNHESPTPLFTFKGHKVEGYGLAWSSCSKPFSNLATGDNDGAVFVWQTGVSFLSSLRKVIQCSVQAHDVFNS